MAVQEHFEGFDQAPDEQSRSAHKREAQALRKLVEKIADLGEQSFKKLVLDPQVKEALIIARSLKPRSDERRRQLQYVAKIQRSCEDFASLEEQVNMLGASSKEDPRTMRFEKLRENLIVGDVSKKAKVESEGDLEASKPNSRALFKYLKSEFTKAGIDVPNELIK